jgi:hypothetical protein
MFVRAKRKDYGLIFINQTWRVAIGGSILQNSLRRKLPADFIKELPSGIVLSYAVIPQINALPGSGLLSVLVMKEVDMKASVDS